MRYINKRNFCMMFLFFFFAGISVNASYSEAASKTSLNKKNITTTVDKKIKLSVKKANKKVLWKSSNNKVATIKKISGGKKQNVTILAKKKGSCVITATIGKKKLKCQIKVKAKVASTNQSTAVTSGKIGLTVTSAVASPSAMTINVTFFNGSELDSTGSSDASFDYSFKLEKWNGAQWITVNGTDSGTVPAVIRSFSPQSTCDVTFQYLNPLEPFSTGKYRITTTLASKSSTAEVNNAAEFTITVQ